MSRAEINRAYYDKTRRKYHAGKLTPLCRQKGPMAKDRPVTCKTCLMVQKTAQIGKAINEWEQKRLKALFLTISRERSAAWRRANPEKASEASRKWREKNRDVHRISSREWSRNNLERRAAYNRQWRANKQGVNP
jgi:hypothetical protein